MPCDSVIETQVDLGKVNRDRLGEVLKTLGWTVYRTDTQVSASKSGYTLVVSETESLVRSRIGKPNDEMLSEIKRAYAARTVSDAAKRFGFRVQQSAEKNKTVSIKIGR